ncbi:hypothetical protein Dret_2146 [Desulfohalobium retbaense DSM 5692]|uniref:Uncharacterized protein n=1 Tax=Desulfohalobium retbaense (strain ATCC 49708 / DSM 5692 / JCM 16813 / HR100) TaxID=485915 RepID=C8X4T3_DESRD|nr:hypothetical protein Dret_2146 [Desulfohalobium retbaense DSM 5692]
MHLASFFYTPTPPPRKSFLKLRLMDAAPVS